MSTSADYAIRTFLTSEDWRGNGDVELLFAEYVRAGYIDPKRAVRLPDNYSGIYPCGSRPLEAAAHLVNFDVFETLLDVVVNDIDLQEATAYVGPLVNSKFCDEMLSLLLTRNQQMLVQRIMRSQANAPMVKGPSQSAHGHLGREIDSTFCQPATLVAFQPFHVMHI